jgi:hypothetical protein
MPQPKRHLPPLRHGRLAKPRLCRFIGVRAGRAEEPLLLPAPLSRPFSKERRLRRLALWRSRRQSTGKYWHTAPGNSPGLPGRRLALRRWPAPRRSPAATPHGAPPRPYPSAGSPWAVPDCRSAARLAARFYRPPDSAGKSAVNICRLPSNYSPAPDES